MSSWTIELTNWLCDRCGAEYTSEDASRPPGWTFTPAGADRCDTCRANLEDQ